MKRTALILSVFIFLSACSPAADDAAADGNSANLKAANQSAANQSAPATVASNANARIIPLDGVDPDAFNGNSANLRTVDRSTSNTRPAIGPRPAPDESEFQAKGRPDGSFVEMRTFKNHPQLARVEKVTNGRKVSIKVYLKNGKSYDLTEDKIPNYRIAAAENILLAVGIKPVQPKQTADQTKKETKDEKEADTQ